MEAFKRTGKGFGTFKYWKTNKNEVKVQQGRKEIEEERKRAAKEEEEKVEERVKFIGMVEELDREGFLRTVEAVKSEIAELRTGTGSLKEEAGGLNERYARIKAELDEVKRCKMAVQEEIEKEWKEYEDFSRGIEEEKERIRKECEEMDMEIRMIEREVFEPKRVIKTIKDWMGWEIVEEMSGEFRTVYRVKHKMTYLEFMLTEFDEHYEYSLVGTNLSEEEVPTDMKEDLSFAKSELIFFYSDMMNFIYSKE
jgi:hypothetical protein